MKNALNLQFSPIGNILNIFNGFNFKSVFKSQNPFLLKLEHHGTTGNGGGIPPAINAINGQSNGEGCRYTLQFQVLLAPDKVDESGHFFVDFSLFKGNNKIGSDFKIKMLTEGGSGIVYTDDKIEIFPNYFKSQKEGKSYVEMEVEVDIVNKDDGAAYNVVMRVADHIPKTGGVHIPYDMSNYPVGVQYEVHYHDLLTQLAVADLYTLEWYNVMRELEEIHLADHIVVQPLGQCN